MIDTILQDRYQIRDLLSQKQGRRTYLALDLQSKNLVIIKILRFDPDFRWDDLDLFKREASTLQNLDHAALPTYLNYFDLTDGFALVQTYIEAPSLQTIIESGRKFSEDEVIEIANKLLDILTYLHDCLPPVIHRDIKPSNILLGDRSGNSIGDVYLVDFGSVQTAASNDGSTITIVGSYGYTPPEQFYGQTISISDLYSLGMTLIYLITGTHPARLVSINGRVKFDRSNLSNRFYRWLEKMTEYSVDRRFQSTKLAQIALTSTDGSYGEFLHLRPKDSQVELYRDLDRLEIKLFQTQSNGTEEDLISACLSLLCAVGGLASMGAIFYLPFVWTIMSWSMRISLLAILPVTIALCNISDKYNNTKTYSGYLVISIDRITKTMKLGTYSVKERKMYWKDAFPNSPEISLLAYKPSYKIDSFFDEESGKHKSGIIKTSPSLSIYMDRQEYNIADNNLSVLEFQWLGQELSDFLNLELHIIYPTPINPAPVSCSSCGGCGCF
jgi:serine/threonine protein kinase